MVNMLVKNKAAKKVFRLLLCEYNHSQEHNPTNPIPVEADDQINECILK